MELHSKKKNLIILFSTIYIITILISIHVYNVLLTNSFTLNSSEHITLILNKITNNLSKNIISMPKKGYLNVFLIITFIFAAAVFIKLIDIKNTMPKVERGSAKWGNVNKLTKKLKDKDKYNNFILSKNLRVSLNQRLTGLNGHVLIVAGSGAGKTRSILLNNLLQFKESYVVLDIKGEIFDYTAKIFKEKGYQIKVLNLRKLSKSFRFNPFVYFVDETSVYKFVDVIINATGKDSNDPFWINNARTLLNAACIYVYQEVPKEYQTMNTVTDIVNAFECSEDNENFKSKADIIFNDLYKEKGETLAYKLYRKVRKNGAKTLKSIIGDVNTRLSVFDFKDMKNIFSGDELDLNSFTEQKTILYLITSDTNSAFDFIVNIFYQVSIDFFIEKADEQGTFKIPLRYHMDEFCNAGKIGGENGFKKILATARSRGMYFNLYIQSVNDIKALYKDDYESIMDNLDIKCWLGKSSFKWVSDMLGKQTIDSISISRNKGLKGNISENISTLSRELMTADEAQNFDRNKCIVFINGENPIVDYKFDIKNNSLYKKLGNPQTKNNTLKIENILFDMRIDDVESTQTKEIALNKSDKHAISTQTKEDTLSKNNKDTINENINLEELTDIDED